MIIKDVRCYPVSFAVRPEYMIKTTLGLHSSSHYVIIAVECSDGTIGWGEATVVPIWSGETQGGAMTVLQEFFTPLLLGRDVADVEQIMTDLDHCIVGNNFTKAAVEMALLDAAAKSVNQPLYRYLGGEANPLYFPIKFSIGLRNPEDTAKIALERVSEGFKAIKIKVGTDLKQDLERVARVREAIGPEILMNIDVNGGWQADEALVNIPLFMKYNVAYVEQPTPRGDLEGMAKVTRQSDVPIMADESVFTVEQALEVIRKKAADIISIYPGKNGGILNSRRISQEAEASGIACHIGSNLEWDIATSAMCQLAACSANVQLAHYPPDILGPLYYSDHPLHAVDFRDGHVRVPEGPGLGLTINEDEIQQFSRPQDSVIGSPLAVGGK